jgi:hypothetical protein
MTLTLTQQNPGWKAIALHHHPHRNSWQHPRDGPIYFDAKFEITIGEGKAAAIATTTGGAAGRVGPSSGQVHLRVGPPSRH